MADGFNIIDDFLGSTDPSKLNQLIKGLESLNTVITKTGKSFEAAQKKVQSSLDESVNEIKNLEKSLKSLDSTQEKNAKEVFNNVEAVEKQAKQIENLQKQNKKLEEIIKKLTKTSQEATEAENQAAAAKAESERLDKERIKLNEKLNQSLSKQSIENAKLKLQIQAKNKEAKQTAKIELGLVDAYTKLSMELNENRKAYKALAAEEKESTEKGKKLLKVIEEQDKKLKDIDASVGQFQRNVGNYAGAVSGLSGEFDKLNGKLDGITDGLKSLDGSLQLNNLFTASGLISQIGDSLTKTSENSEDTRVAFSKISATFEVLTVSIGGAIAALIQVFEIIEKEGFTSAKLGDALNKITSSFDNFGERVNKNIKAAEDLTKKTIEYEKELRGLRLEQQTAADQLERLELLRDAESNSLQERARLAKQAQEAAEVLGSVEVRLADERLKLLEKEELARRKAGSLDNELLNALADAQVEYTAALAQQQRLRIQAAQENQTIQDDIIEQTFDFLIDGVDVQKSINERVIANERIALSEREKILNRTEELQRDTFQAQIYILQKRATEEIDFNSLLKEVNAENITRILQNAGLSERIAKRGFEIIKEQKLAEQDLADLRKDIFDQQQEQLLNDPTLKLQEKQLERLKKLRSENFKDAESFNKQITDSEKDFEEQQLNNQIAALQKEIENRKSANQVIVKEQKELNDLLIQQQEVRINKELALLEKEAAEKARIKEEQDANDQKNAERRALFTNAINEGLKERFNLEAQLLEQQAASAESAGARAELQAEAARAREKAQVRAAIADAFVAELNDSGDVGQATRAAGQALVAIKTTQAVASLFKGGSVPDGFTGNIGESTPVMAELHGGEHVMNHAQVMKYGIAGLTAEQLDRKIESGHFDQFSKVNEKTAKGFSVINNTQVIQQEIDYDKFGASVAKHQKLPNFENLIGGIGVSFKENNRTKKYFSKTYKTNCL